MRVVDDNSYERTVAMRCLALAHPPIQRCPSRHSKRTLIPPSRGGSLLLRRNAFPLMRSSPRVVPPRYSSPIAQDLKTLHYPGTAAINPTKPWRSHPRPRIQARVGADPQLFAIGHINYLRSDNPALTFESCPPVSKMRHRRVCQSKSCFGAVSAREITGENRCPISEHRRP